MLLIIIYDPKSEKSPCNLRPFKGAQAIVITLRNSGKLYVFFLFTHFADHGVSALQKSHGYDGGVEELEEVEDAVCSRLSR